MGRGRCCWEGKGATDELIINPSFLFDERTKMEKSAVDRGRTVVEEEWRHTNWCGW